MGHFADSYGRRTGFLTFSLIWYSITTEIMAFPSSGFGVDLWRPIAGIGIGVGLVTIDIYVSELVPSSHRGRAYAYNQFLQFLAVPIVTFFAWHCPNRRAGWHGTAVIVERPWSAAYSMPASTPSTTSHSFAMCKGPGLALVLIGRLKECRSHLTMVISNDHMEATMGGCRIVSASEFKAKCLDILDRIHNRELERVVITKRGVAVALLLPPEAQAAQVERLHGFLRGSVVIPPTVDLTAPIADEPFDADQDEIHR